MVSSEQKSLNNWGVEKLVWDMDSLIGYLSDEDVQEVMVNNKALWVDIISEGMFPIGLHRWNN
jgi:hypothetical protein